MLRSICAPCTERQLVTWLTLGTKLGTMRPLRVHDRLAARRTGSTENTKPVADCELPPVRDDVKCSAPILKS